MSQTATHLTSYETQDGAHAACGAIVDYDEATEIVADVTCPRCQIVNNRTPAQPAKPVAWTGRFV